MSPFVRAAVALGSLIVTVSSVVPGAEALDSDEKEIQSIELAGTPGTRFIINGRTYAGPVTFGLYDDGIALSEVASIEQYLEGIAEMPFSWPTQALRAQAVAARTYLARRLLPDRAGDAAEHDYDICATSRCQVYRGTSLVDDGSGERWRAAVRDTADELILYEGKPIEAVYTSMVGSRSRANQDVWPSAPVPYLQAVDSPEVGIAPYAEWTVEVTAEQFVAILQAEGLDVAGRLVSISIDDPAEGDGRTTISVTTEGGTDQILAPKLKGAFNRYGDALFPGLLPVRLEDGKKLPQPLLSYTFDLDRVVSEPSSLELLLPEFDRIGSDVVLITGEGWGHGVGMSQWGARIFADNGSTYAEILSHYYSGLVPERVPDLVPDEVVVGLATDRVHVDVEIDGEAEILVNGVPSGSFVSGAWMIRDATNGLDLVPIMNPGAVSPIVMRNWPR